jgi:hypothetical protein
MAIRVVCLWLVGREDVAKWAQLFMARKGTMEIARLELEEERRHKVLVMDYAFEMLARELDRQSFVTMVSHRLSVHVWSMRQLVNEVKVLSMNRKLDAVPYIGDEIKEALNQMMRDVDELTNFGYTPAIENDICANAERLSDIKRAWTVFKDRLALRRAPDEPARP